MKEKRKNRERKIQNHLTLIPERCTARSMYLQLQEVISNKCYTN